MQLGSKCGWYPKAVTWRSWANAAGAAESRGVVRRWCVNASFVTSAGWATGLPGFVPSASAPGPSCMSGANPASGVPPLVSAGCRLLHSAHRTASRLDRDGYCTSHREYRASSAARRPRSRSLPLPDRPQQQVTLSRLVGNGRERRAVRGWTTARGCGTARLPCLPPLRSPRSASRKRRSSRTARCPGRRLEWRPSPSSLRPSRFGRCIRRR